MEKLDILIIVGYCVILFLLGFMFGCIYNDYNVITSGIEETSYCKEIQIDTIQYNYKQNLYKYKIEIIK